VATAEEAEVEPVPAEPVPPANLGPPTEAEFRAWDRRDPETEAKLDAWDRDNLDRMLRMFDELRCFHQTVLLEGERFMADPRGEPRWHELKHGTILALDEWQKRVFAENPRILEKSRLLGHFLEAHELAAFTYPRAYDARDRTEIDQCDAHWAKVESKIRQRAEKLGGRLAASPVRCDPPPSP
jgi:hypothetical protein